jgi:hypothetical protein
MLKYIALICLIMMALACSEKSWKTNPDFEAGYDAGYDAGFSDGTDSVHDAEKDNILQPGTIDADNQVTDPGDDPMKDPSAGPAQDTIKAAGDDHLTSEADDRENIPGADTLTGEYTYPVNNGFNQDRNTLSGRDHGTSPDTGRESTGFFTGGLNLYTIIVLISVIFIIWQLLILRNRITDIYKNTRILKDIAKSQRISRNIDTITSRLARIESVLFNQAHLQPEGNERTENTRGPAENPPDTLPQTGNSRAEGDDGTNDSTVVFFMPSPDNEGNFDNRKKSDHFIPSESIYKFVINEDPDQAKFYIFQDPNNMERAINYFSSILEKVCRSENAFNPLGKAIKTIEPGIAVLSNNKWVVKEKALIRYD